jgi:predicted DNA binding CopG/RHH family protein
MAKLDKEELELLESVETGEWQPVQEREKELKRFQEYARATLEKAPEVN